MNLFVGLLLPAVARLPMPAHKQSDMSLFSAAPPPSVCMFTRNGGEVAGYP
jgi:hypothetical protein